MPSIPIATLSRCVVAFLRQSVLLLLFSDSQQIVEQFGKTKASNQQVGTGRFRSFWGLFSSYIPQVYMIIVTMRVLFQALAMHYYDHGTLQRLSALDCSIKLFTIYFADNLFYCLSYSPLPLTYVSYYWLLFQKSSNDQFWEKGLHYFSFLKKLKNLFRVVSFDGWKLKLLKQKDIYLFARKFKDAQEVATVAIFLLYCQKLEHAVYLIAGKFNFNFYFLHFAQKYACCSFDSLVFIVF